jgi:hypothetical protein
MMSLVIAIQYYGRYECMLMLCTVVTCSHYNQFTFNCCLDFMSILMSLMLKRFVEEACQSQGGNGI